MGEGDKKPETKAAAIGIEIAFKEIGPMFDLHDRRRVIGTPEKPTVVYESLMNFGGYSKYDPKYEDEFGKKIYDLKAGDIPGVYQGIRITAYAAWLRTFSRKQVVEIDDKWVYLFHSESKSGSGIKLAGEMAFAKGEMQLIDLAKHTGKDERPASGEKRKSLHIVLKALSKDKGPFFWFFLAPYQLSWKALENMVKSGGRLASRCQRLFDEFYTDAVIGGGEPKNFSELKKETDAGKPMTFMVYLVDPFKEALRRSALYVEAVDFWQKLQTDLGSDEEYVLAKRIENLPKEYVDVVWNRLSSYLGEKEKVNRLLLRIATNRLEDLMRWIGENHQRDTVGLGGGKSVVSSDTWYVHADGKASAVTERKEDTTWYNPYCDLIGDYHNDGTPPGVHTQVGIICSTVHSRLDALPRGSDFMLKMVKDSDRLPIADAGAKMLFEAGRKLDASAAETAGMMLEHYAPHWVKVYRKDALPELIKFMREKHKIELKKIKPMRVQKLEAKLARKAHDKAAKKGLERLAAHYHVSVDPASAKAIGMTARGLNRIAMGVEVFNLKNSIFEFASEPDVWGAVGLAGSVLDASSALAKLWDRLDDWTFKFKGASKAIKVMPLLAVVSSTIDSVLAIRDTYNSTNYGQSMGHGMRSVGALLTVGGATMAATGAGAIPGAILTIVGLGLQALGSGIASQYDDMKLFLRHSKWGEPNFIDRNSWFDSNGFGYKGDLEKLKNDITAQHRALDWLFWVFKPSLGNYNGAQLYIPSRLWLKVNPPKGISAGAKWTIKLELESKVNGKLSTWEWKPDENYDDTDLSAGTDELWILRRNNDPPSGQATISAARHEYVKVKGQIKLDVFGDGKNLVVREIDQKVDVSF